MLCAFYLGLVSGQKAGFETAQSINLASVAKLPVPDQYREEDLEAVASDVYAKLGSGKETPAPVAEEGVEVKAEPVDLTPIETKKVARPAKEDKEAAIVDDTEAGTQANKDIIRILSEPPSKKSANSKKAEAKKEATATLGSLLDESSEGEIVVEDKRKPEVDGDISTEKSVLASLSKDPVVVKPAAKIEPVKKEVVKEAPAKIVEKKVETPVRKVEVKETKVAPKLKEQPKPKATTVISKGWYAQVAAPSRKEDAVILTQKLKNSGFRATVETANIRGEEYYRVLVGPEEEKRYSQTMVDQLKREPFIKGVPFLRFIK
jgi:cell division septation protein DedD